MPGGLDISWTVQGDLALADKLAEVRSPRRHIRPAMRKGGTVIRQAIQGMIPPRESADRRKGETNVLIRRAIGAKISERGGKLQLLVGSSIGPTHAKKLGLPRAKAIARLAYFTGTEWRKTKSGRSTGRITPKDIITRGGRSASGRAMQVISTDLAQRLDKALMTQRANSTQVLVTP